VGDGRGARRAIDEYLYGGVADHTKGHIVDLKLEVVPMPVSDVDAAKAFYTERVGFNLDHDIRPGEGMRVVQMTPPGSACSVVIGEGLPLGEPGSVKGVQLTVDDIDAVRDELAGRGVAISEVQQLGPEGTPGSRYAFFDDPDGNLWAVQEYKRS
jgi:catechol 2,3-dioxygenase-like lactoylglutathione lyase family enzyme